MAAEPTQPRPRPRRTIVELAQCEQCGRREKMCWRSRAGRLLCGWCLSHVRTPRKQPRQ